MSIGVQARPLLTVSEAADLLGVWTRPHVRVADYLALVERSTYGDDCVRIT